MQKIKEHVLFTGIMGMIREHTKKFLKKNNNPREFGKCQDCRGSSAIG